MDYLDISELRCYLDKSMESGLFLARLLVMMKVTDSSTLRGLSTVALTDLQITDY